MNGYNDKGKKTFLQIQFKNNKPAKKFAAEMFQATGLGMGEIRTAEEIRRIEAGESEDDLYGDNKNNQGSNLQEDKKRKSLEMTNFQR